MTILTRDDIFTDKEKDDIEKYLTTSFPWFLGEGHENTAGYELYNHFKNDNPIFENFQLCHGIVDEGNITTDLSELFLEMNKKLCQGFDINGKLLRIKANLQPRSHAGNQDCYNTPHIDNLKPHWIMIYYVNDSDGDTFIFENTINKDNCDWDTDKYWDPAQYPKKLSIKTRIRPKKGRVVLFDGKFLHSGMHPAHSKYRMVINFNIEKA